MQNSAAGRAIKNALVSGGELRFHSIISGRLSLHVHFGSPPAAAPAQRRTKLQSAVPAPEQCAPVASPCCACQHAQQRALTARPPVPSCAGADLVKALQNVGGRENFIFGATAESVLVRSTLKCMLKRNHASACFVSSAPGSTACSAAAG